MFSLCTSESALIHSIVMLCKTILKWSTEFPSFSTKMSFIWLRSQSVSKKHFFKTFKSCVYLPLFWRILLRDDWAFFNMIWVQITLLDRCLQFLSSKTPWKCIFLQFGLYFLARIEPSKLCDEGSIIDHGYQNKKNQPWRHLKIRAKKSTFF